MCLALAHAMEAAAKESGSGVEVISMTSVRVLIGVAGFASRNAGDRDVERFPLAVTRPGLRLTSYRWCSPGILGGYAMTIRRILCTAGVLTVIGASLVGVPASAEKDVEDPLATLLSQPIATDIKASTLPGASRVADGSGLASGILPAIAIAQSRRWGGAANEIVCDRDKRELLIYAASKRAEITSALSSAKTTVPARVVPAGRPFARSTRSMQQCANWCPIRAS